MRGRFFNVKKSASLLRRGSSPLITEAGGTPQKQKPGGGWGSPRREAGGAPPKKLFHFDAFFPSGGGWQDILTQKKAVGYTSDPTASMRKKELTYSITAIMSEFLRIR